MPERKKTRHSQQRDVIYDYLRSTREHPSAEAIYTELKAKMPNLSLGTVYRNLKLLEESGKIRRISALQNAERYDCICCDHAHFVCTKCGKVRDLEPIDVHEAAGAFTLEDGDVPLGVSLTISGICAECRKNALDRTEKKETLQP